MRYFLAFFLLMPILAQAKAVDTPRCLPTQIERHAISSKKPAILRLNLEIAATPETREHGLMNRQTIGPCDGMTFFLSSLAPQKFWMKNTLIPLDILFVNEDNRIIFIAHASPLSEEPMGPDTPVATVIEIAGGRAQKDGIRVGDRVFYELQTYPYNLAR